MIKRIANKVLSKIGIRMMRASSFKKIVDDRDQVKASHKEVKESLIELFEMIAASKLFSGSKAQLHQDLFVLLYTNFKSDGFFVEFGATDGVELSNTYLLESEYGWQGILAEPGRSWHKQLAKNRSGIIEHSCVWKETGERIEFFDADSAEYSTIGSYVDSDHHEQMRVKGEKYKVETLSLTDLLRKHNAPTKIDYLSIDTEGSEFEILSRFDFQKYEISVISCEHNYTENREKIHHLLSRHGYVRKFPALSRFDDWYVKVG